MPSPPRTPKKSKRSATNPTMSQHSTPPRRPTPVEKPDADGLSTEDGLGRARTMARSAQFAPSAASGRIDSLTSAATSSCSQAHKSPPEPALIKHERVATTNPDQGTRAVRSLLERFVVGARQEHRVTTRVVISTGVRSSLTCSISGDGFLRASFAPEHHDRSQVAPSQTPDL